MPRRRVLHVAHLQVSKQFKPVHAQAFTPNGVETCLKNSEESKMLRDRRTNWPGTHSKCVCWHACIIGVRPEKSPVCTIIGSLKLPAADAAVLVAKPVPRKLWTSMPKAQKSVDDEWTQLRHADGGLGTWDESSVREYWDVRKEADKKHQKTGIHTRFGTLFDLCVEKHSEFEEAKTKF